ncbi:ComEC/Rec2 family competence protein [Streptacidiphilus monticola]
MLVTARGESGRAWLALLPSTKVRTAARLRPPGDTGPEDVAAVLAVRGAPELLAPPSLPQRLAGRLRAGLRRAVAGLGPDERALLPGLVVGDTAAMTPELEEAFQATDLAHVTAVSGANLSIVLVLLVGAAARARSPERGGIAARTGLTLRGTALAGAGLTVAFVVLCRPDPSVLRAGATGLIMLLGLATGRRTAPLTALAAATLILVLADPWLARSFGFALSALATGGLVTLGPRWAEALQARGWPHRLAEGVAAAAAAQACVGPLLVLRLAKVSLVAIPCNLLAEVAVAPATLLGFAALAAAPLGTGPAAFLAWLASWPCAGLIALARFGAGMPGAELDWAGGWSGAALLVLVIAALAASSRFLLRSRAALAMGALALLLALLRPAPLTRLATGWPPPDWRLVACDVGQGDALVLAAGPGSDAAVVVDAGPDPHAVDHCLHELGIDRVPLLLLTHDHADHVEGVPGVLHDRQVGAVETTTADDPPAEYARVRRWAAAAGVPLRHVVPGERGALGDLHWQVLWPDGSPDAAGLGPNNASISLLVTVAGLRLALLGDLEPPAQQRLLAALPNCPELYGVDVLKVAHHGSARQDADLLRALRPRLALVSVGSGNPYGHPAPAALRGLASLGAVVVRTDQDGAIAVLGQGRRLAVATQRGR